MRKREELRVWLDSQRELDSDEPLSGTLALAKMVADLQALADQWYKRLEAVENLVATPPDEDTEE